MAYRPSVRYSETYEKYVKAVDESTHLDRNQIIRLALFVAAHSPEYQSILKKYKKDGVSLPQADWGRDEDGLWKNQSYTPKPKGPENPGNIRVIKKGGIRYIANASPIG